MKKKEKLTQNLPKGFQNRWGDTLFLKKELFPSNGSFAYLMDNFSSKDVDKLEDIISIEDEIIQREKNESTK